MAYGQLTALGLDFNTRHPDYFRAEIAGGGLVLVSWQKDFLTRTKWRSTYLRRRKRHHVINLQLDANLLADLVVVVRGHERKHFAAGREL